MQQKRDLFGQFLEASGVFLFSFLFLSVISQVIFRYVLHISVPWTEELARLLNIWITFIGAAILQKSEGHLRVDYFLGKLSLKVRSCFFVAIDLLACVYMASVLWGTLKLMKEVWVYTAASMPWLSMGYFYLPLLIGSTLMVFFLLMRIGNNLRFIKGK